MQNPFSPSGGNTRTPSVGRRVSCLACIRCHRSRRPPISVCRAMTPPGLIWLLQGDPVVALTETTAAIRHATGNITTYRRFHKPALGPLGDSLDDMEACR